MVPMRARLHYLQAVSLNSDRFMLVEMMIKSNRVFPLFSAHISFRGYRVSALFLRKKTIPGKAWIPVPICLPQAWRPL